MIQTSLICGNESSQTRRRHADRYLVGGMSSALSRSFTRWGMLQLEHCRPLPLACAQENSSTFLSFWCLIEQPLRRYHWAWEQQMQILHPAKAAMKRHLAFFVFWGFSFFFTSQENPPTLLMCPIEWNHVHLCITFRLDLNGTLPLLTLGSAAPDKLICEGPSLPPAHRENTVTLRLFFSGPQSQPCLS